MKNFTVNRNGNKSKFFNLKIKLHLASTAANADEINKEIMEILNDMKFNKISIPITAKGVTLYTPKEDEEKSHYDGRKTYTIGFIRDFDKEELTFDVLIFNKYEETFNGFGDSARITPIYTVFNNDGVRSLKSIIRFSVITVSDEQQ